MHDTVSELKSLEIKLKDNFEHPQYPDLAGKMIIVEDWWDRVMGKSWMICDGNPACLIYAMRTGVLMGYRVPVDNEVLYVHDKLGLGHLIHITEVEETKKLKKYIAMNGMKGCLPNYSEEFDTYTEACEDLIKLLELEDDLLRKKVLLATGFVELDLEKSGAEYAEVTEV